MPPSKTLKKQRARQQRLAQARRRTARRGRRRGAPPLPPPPPPRPARRASPIGPTRPPRLPQSEDIRRFEEALDAWEDEQAMARFDPAAVSRLWDEFVTIADGHPEDDLATLQRRMRRGSLVLFVVDVIEGLLLAVRKDVILASRLRAVCDDYLRRFHDDPCGLTDRVRGVRVRAIEWSEGRDAAERAVEAWLAVDRRNASAWVTWSELYFEPGYVPLPENDPQRALALVEEGLRVVPTVEGRAELMTQKINLLAQCGTRAAYDEAFAAWRLLAALLDESGPPTSREGACGPAAPW